MRIAGTAAALLLLAGCAGREHDRIAPIAAAEPPPSAPWEGVITADDRERLAQLPTQWASALSVAREGAPRQAQAEAALIDIPAALPHPALPPGSYRCRTVRLGDAARPVEAFRPFFCFVKAEGGQLTFVKQTGTDLPAGWLYPDGEARYVFLGTRASADVVPGSLAYGARPAADLAGVIERIGDFRWRLVLPTRESARVDIYELVPVPTELGQR